MNEDTESYNLHHESLINQSGARENNPNHGTANSISFGQELRKTNHKRNRLFEDLRNSTTCEFAA